MSEENFDIRFSQAGAAEVVKAMRDVVTSATSAAEATENLQDQLSKTRNAASPAQAAYEKLAGGIDVLGRAQRANLITGREEAQLRTNLIGRMEAQVRPFGTLISSIQAETRAYAASNTVRDASLRTMRQLQTLQARGVQLSNEEREALTRTNVAYVQQREQSAAAAAAERERARAAEAASRAAVAATEREAAAKAKLIENAGRGVAAERRRAAQEAANAAAARERLLANASRGVASLRAGQDRRDGIVGSVVPKIEAETRAYELNTVERQANLRTIQQSEALRTAGIALSEEEVAAIREANLAYAQQREAVKLLEQTQRELGGVRSRLSPNSSAAASSRLNADRATLGRASAVGLISSGEQAQLEQALTRAYEEQINPLVRTQQLLEERANYQRGLFDSGRTLAQVEREIASATAAGIPVSSREVAALRSQAREIDHLERAYRSLSEFKGLFGNLLGGLALAGGAGELARSLDQTTNVRNLVGVTSTSGNNQNDVTDQVYKVAEQTHAEVDATAKLYSRLELGAQRFGYGQKQVLGLTKEVNEQIRLSGTSEGESTRAVIDFAHAIGSGNVQFRELRALTQQAPFVSVQIAKGLTALAQESTKQGEAFKARAAKAGIDVDKRAIGVGDLKELTSKRAIGSGDIFSAEQLEADDTQKRFEKLTPTIAQATTDLKTFFLQYLDGANQSTGASRNIAGAIEFIGRNLGTIIPLVLILGSGIAGLFVAEKILSFITILEVVGSKLGLIGTSSRTNKIAIDANTGAMDSNASAAATNKTEIDAVTASLARNTLARRENSGAVSGVGAPGKRGIGAGGTAVPITGEAEEAAVGVEGAAAGAGAAEAGLGIAGAFTIALPLILAAGTAFALLKDNVEVAKSAILSYNDEGVTKSIQGNITLGDVATGIFQSLIAGSSSAKEAQKADVADLTDAQKKADQAKLDSATKAFSKSGDYFDQLNSRLLRGLVRVVAAFIEGLDKIQLIFDTVAGGIVVVMANAFQGIANGFIDLVNKTLVPGANLLLNATGQKSIGNIGHVDLVSGADRANAGLKKRDQDKVNDDVKNGLNNVAKAIIGTAVKRQSVRPSSITDSGGNGDDGLANEKKKKPKKDPVETAFDDLVKKTLPAVAAIKAFSDAMDTLKKATDKGYVQKTVDTYNDFSKAHPEDKLGSLSSGELVTRIKAQAQRELQDVILPGNAFDRDQSSKQAELTAAKNNPDPFNRTISSQTSDQLKKEADALKLTIDQYKALQPQRESAIRAELSETSALEQQVKVTDALRAQSQGRALGVSQLGESPELVQAQTEAYAIYKDQLLAGVAGAKAAYDANVQQNLSFIKLKEDVDKTKEAYEGIVGPQKQFTDTVASLNNLLGQGLISLDKYNEKVRDSEKSLLDADGDKSSLFTGFEKGLLDIKKESENTAGDVEKTFKDAYDNIENDFSNLFTGTNTQTIKQNLKKLFQDVAGDASKALFHKLTDPLISQIGKKAGVPGFGDKAMKAERADITATNVYVNGQQQKGAQIAGDTNPFAPSTSAPAGVSQLPSSANDNSTPQIGQVGAFNFGSAASQSSIAGNGQIGAFNFGQLNGETGSAFGASTSLNTGSTFGASTVPSLTGGAGDFSFPQFQSLLGGAGSAAGGLGTSGLGGDAGIFGGLGGLSSGFGGIEGGIKSLSDPGGDGAGPLGKLGGILSGGKQLLGGLGSGISGIGGLLGIGGGAGGAAGGLGGLLGGAGGAGGLGSLLGGASGGLGSLFSSLGPLAGLFGFATGGSFNVGGSGGTDSQVVSFKATPGENVSVGTPSQLQAAHDAAANAGSQAPPQVNQKIVNVMDPQSAIDAMATQAGYKTILNHIQSNPEAIKRALGS